MPGTSRCPRIAPRANKINPHPHAFAAITVPAIAQLPTDELCAGGSRPEAAWAPRAVGAKRTALTRRAQLGESNARWLACAISRSLSSFVSEHASRRFPR